MQELSTYQFLKLLKQHSVQVRAKDGRLQIIAPTGALDAQLRAELARRKGDLLATFLDNEVASPTPALIRVDRTSKIPLTYAQQGMWLVDHLNPGNATYNIPEAFVLQETADQRVLQKAVDELLDRHETLRTTFYEEDGELFQRISSKARTAVDFTDLSSLPEHDRDRTLYKLIRQEARKPFNLQQAPLVRFHLFRLAAQKDVIFINIHHIISDRRSLIILREELPILYQAAARNAVASLAPLPIQYADYAVWATKQLASEAIEKQTRYWMGQLANLPASLELPSGRPYPKQRMPWGATTPIVITESLRGTLNTIGQEEGASIFMTLLTAFAALLYRQTGCLDFCIGSPFTHRKLVETEPIIGLFVNMLVLRCKIEEGDSFRALLRRTRNTALEAYENSDVPFQQLVRALKVDTRSQRSPLFQIMFGFDNDIPTSRDESGSLQINTNPGTARYDLTLQLGNTVDGIVGEFEYCTDLFDKPSILLMSQQFSELLNEVAQQPDAPLPKKDAPSGIGPAQTVAHAMASPNKPNGLVNKVTQWLSLPRGKN